MVNHTADISQHKAAKVAGLAYFLIIITSILSMIFGPYKLIVEGDVAKTINNITNNMLLFRIGVVYDIIMFSSVIILAVALYATLKPVNKNLGLLALSWRLAEAILGCLTALCSLIILLLLNGEAYSNVFGAEQLQTIVGLFLDISSAALSIVFIFLSLGTIIFCYLFLKARYIPRILALWGIFSFLLMLICTFISILLPQYASIVEMVGYPPAIIFEVTIGIWLFFKGINVKGKK